MRFETVLMVKVRRAYVACLILAIASFGVENHAAVAASSRSFTVGNRATCSQLRKTSPNGIASSRSKVKKSKALVSSVLYKKYKYLDTNNNGIVCERSERAIIAVTSPLTVTPTIPVPTATTVPVQTPSTNVPLTTSSTVAPTTVVSSTTTTVPGSFMSGTKLVGGTGIAPGRYVSTTASSCYWERLRGFSGQLSDIIANDNPPGSHVIVDISASDSGFNSSRCGTWQPFVASPQTSIGNGVWKVNDEIQPGLWSATFTTSCYWARLTGFGGSSDEIIANGLPSTSALVQIYVSDVGFLSTRCGTWTKVG